jgi:hypothetical protein
MVIIHPDSSMPQRPIKTGHYSYHIIHCLNARIVHCSFWAGKKMVFTALFSYCFFVHLAL